MNSILILKLLFISAIFFILYKALRSLFSNGGKTGDSGTMVCQNCGTRGEPKIITPGSTLIELVLWLCFIVPGLIYSLWRISARKKGCPSCGQTNMIDVNTPIGKQIIEKLRDHTAAGHAGGI